MNATIGPVWVIAEQIDGEVVGVSLQLIGHARKLADQLGVALESVLLGDGVEAQANKLIAAGVDKVYLYDDPQLAFYQPEVFTEAIVQLAEANQPDIMLLGSTFMGRELAPVLAARLKTGLSAHCIDLVLAEDKNLEQRIPAYGGLMSIICPDKRPQMATVAKGVFPTPGLDEDRVGEVLPVDLPTAFPQRVQVLEVVREAKEGIPLETAPTVVAGGIGAGEPAGWQEIVELADTLNAALGSTRPVVDEGWAELETMVGQSGKMVSPELYIGVGLSGELQHMVGIVGAKMMVAINNDPKAPVFEQVDLGVAADGNVYNGADDNGSGTSGL